MYFGSISSVLSDFGVCEMCLVVYKGALSIFVSIDLWVWLGTCRCVK